MCKNIILTGQYGIPRPWYFPFTKSYWCGEKCGWVTAAPTNKKENAEGEPKICTKVLFGKRKICFLVVFIILTVLRRIY